MQIDSHTKWLLGLWLTLPPTAMNFWRASSCFPPSVASSLVGAFLVFVFILVVLTGVNVLVRAMSHGSAPGLLIVSYLAIGFLCLLVNNGAWHMRGAGPSLCAEQSSASRARA